MHFAGTPAKVWNSSVLDLLTTAPAPTIQLGAIETLEEITHALPKKVL
jgi:hypothetical protein